MNNTPFLVLRDYRKGCIIRLAETERYLLVVNDDGSYYNHKDKQIDCLLLLGLLETMSLIIIPSYDLREILDQ